MAEGTVTVTTPVAGPIAPIVPDPTRPAWLPAKFKTAEEFAASYTELEKKIGTQVITPAAIDAALKDKALDLNKLSAEYLANGKKLTDATMATLKEKGITAEQVQQVINDRETAAAASTKLVHDSVGGTERFNQLQQFAAASYNADEIKAYNAAVTNGDYTTVKLLLQGLNTKFEAAYGKDGKLLGGGAPAQTVDNYENFQEYRNALADPKYKTDRNYREKVDKKLERSTFFKQKQ